MKLVLIIVITSSLHLLVSALPSPQGSSADPCGDSPCGKGAECKSMGSIAICVCPNDGTGDPFVSCLEQVDSENGSSSSPTTTSTTPKFVTSFDVGLVHHSRGSPIPITTSTTTPKTTLKPLSTSSSSSIVTTRRQQPIIITSSTTPPTTSTTTTTTRSPYVHVFEASSSRPATIGHNNHHQQQPPSHNSNFNNQNNQPELHRIPIITPSTNNNYPQHNNLPNPISSSSPSFTYQGGSSSSINSGTTYDPFNEKTVMSGSSNLGPIAGSYGTTRPGSVTHLSGSHYAYEYDSSGPITPPSSSASYHNTYPHNNHHHHNNNQAYHHNYNSNMDRDRYGQHSYHPSSSGFPDPITESTASYLKHNSQSGLGSSSSAYDVYNYNHNQNNPSRNDLPSHTHHHNSGGYVDRITDPLGKYENCRSVNGIIVCADNNNRLHNNNNNNVHFNPHNQHSHNPPPISSSSRDQDDHLMMFRTTSRDRDAYPSSYYPTSLRPLTDYAYDNVNRQGYPSHNYDPISSSSSYPFVPKEQRISAQSVITISNSALSSGSETTMKTKSFHQDRYDSEHPLCKKMCGLNSICRLVLERPVCGCPDGFTGNPSIECVRISEAVDNFGGVINGGNEGGGGVVHGNAGGGSIIQCQQHVDCKQSEICAKNRCIDPCKEQGLLSSSSVNFIGVGSGSGGDDGNSAHSICGRHAECLVVGHTPVCKCHQGYFGNPYVACVP